MHLNKMRLNYYYTNVFRMQYLSRNIFPLSPMHRFKKLEVFIILLFRENNKEININIIYSCNSLVYYVPCVCSFLITYYNFVLTYYKNT